MTTEADVLAHLRRRYAKPGNGGSGEYAFLTHVRNGAGFSATRTFDAVAIDLYPGRGLGIHIIEVKVSRGDWLRELRQPEKSAAAEALADFFWVATPPGIVKRDELGDRWGLIEIRNGRARTMVGAKRLTDNPGFPNGAHPPIDRGFLVGLLRSAHGAVPGRSTWCTETHRWVSVHSDIFPELDPEAGLKALAAAQAESPKP